MVFFRDVRFPCLGVVFTAVVFFAWPQTLRAQSFGDIVAQTGRALSKTVRSAKTALSPGGSPGTSQGRRASNNSTNIDVPPVPERRPKAWKVGKRPAVRNGQPTSLKKQTAQKQPRRSQGAVGNQRVATGARSKGATGSQPGKATGSRTGKLRATTAGKTKVKIDAKTKAKAEPAPAPVVDAWSDVEINIAQARCQHLLKQIDAVVVSQPAIKKGPCGDAAPVKLISIGRSPQVAVSPPAVINCQMVHALHGWLENDLQSLAKKHLGARIVTIENMSSYSCRNAYGRKNTKLSEHARANALDIRGFVVANGKRARLLDDWGPTRRRIAAAAKAAKEKAEKKARVAAQKAAQDRARLAARAKAKSTGQSGARTRGGNTATGVPGDGANGGGVPLPVRGTLNDDARAMAQNGSSSSNSRSRTRSPTGTDRHALGLKPSQLGGPKKKKNENEKKKAGKAGSQAPGGLRVSNRRSARFLRAAFKSGCKTFGTILGPEANHAHRNHFHVDLAPRRRSNYCE